MTDRYAVFGNPVSHSKSPRIHQLFAAQTGQDLEYTAILADVDGFAAAVRAFAAAGGRGANVTVPFKEAACRLADRLTPAAQIAGAVNTLTFADGGVAGANTDGSGLVRDLGGNLGADLRDCRLLLLGAGGAARGVLPALLAAGARIVVANRDAAKAQGVVAELRRALPAAALRTAALSGLSGEEFDIVVNATAAGLSGSRIDLPGGILAPGVLAYDMVYGRATPFLDDARAAGAQPADGLGMLVEQAADAFELWRGVRPQTAPVLALLREEVPQR